MDTGMIVVLHTIDILARMIVGREGGKKAGEVAEAREVEDREG